MRDDLSDAIPYLAQRTDVTKAAAMVCGAVDRAGATPPLWRNRDLVLLWSGQLVSLTGTQVSQFAVPLLVLALTGSPAQAGLVAAARSLPMLILLLPAGGTCRPSGW